MSLTTDWQKWGLPAFASLMAPWHEKLTGISLIGEFFQPELGVIISVLGAVVAMTTYGALNEKAKRRVRSVATASAGGLCVFVAALLFLKYILAPALHVGQIGTLILWGLWIAAYLGLFMLLSIAMMAGFLLVARQRS